MSIRLKDTIYDLINNADKIDNLDSTSLFRKLGTNVDINTFADNSNKNGIIYINTTTPADINAPFSYGTILSFNSDAGSWMLGNSSSGVLKFRNRWWSGNGAVWSDWKDIAFKTDIPTIPTALKNPQALTIQNNGTTVDSYDGSAAKTINITHPTIPTALKCPTSLTIQFNGTSQGAWDGSTAKTINITPAAIGAAATHSHPYLPLSGGTLTGGVGMNSKYLIKPSAEYTCTTTTITGAICITLPASISDTMTSMWVDVYNYVTSTSFSVHVCGYTYTNSTWQHNPSAMVYGANHKVRLGHNGTSFCIYIGETTSTWNYPQVIVRDVIIGYSGNYSNWSKAWTISFVTSFSNVTATLSDYALTTKNWSSICAPASHTHNYASTVKVGSTSYTCSSNVISLPAYPTVPTIPTALKCPTSLTIQANGTSLGSYDGSAAKTFNITCSNIGAAAASHTHTFASLTSKPTTISGFGITDAYTPAKYTTTAQHSGYYKIKINSTAYWMMGFRVRVYKSYQYFDIRFSGYNYGANYWYSPVASLVEGDAAITVYFGYDSATNLWVGIPAGNYTGIEITDVVNGYYEHGKGLRLDSLFTITQVSSLGGTTQSTQTIQPPSKSGHTHDYAASNHTHSYAASSHTHTKSQITDFSHTHDYAASNHSHSGYMTTSSPTGSGTLMMNGSNSRGSYPAVKWHIGNVNWAQLIMNGSGELELRGGASQDAGYATLRTGAMVCTSLYIGSDQITFTT